MQCSSAQKCDACSTGLKATNGKCQCPTNRTIDQQPDYSYYLYDDEGLTKVHLVTRNVAIEPELYSNEAVLRGKCSQLLTISSMGNSGDAGPFDPDTLHCALYHSANYTSSVLAITGITEERLRRSLKSGRVVVTLKKEAA
jgi:hypothetical protein